MDQQQARAQLHAWMAAVHHTRLRQGDLAMGAKPPQPGLLEQVGEGVEDVLNGAASLGQAALDHPEAVIELAGGLALAAGGAAVATGGVVLNATGVGAVAGVPANVAGAGMVAAGGGLAFDGARRIAEAASANPVEPMQVNWGNKGSDKRAEDDANDRDDHQRRSKRAADEQMENLNKTPDDIPPLFRQQEKKGWFW